MAEPWFNAASFYPAFTKPRDTAPFRVPEAIQRAFDRPTTPARLVTRPSAGQEPATPPMSIPGMVGDLVAYCWNNSPHQIAEVSIASALSVMSTLCSRQYRIGSQSVTLYLLLLCKSSIGKSFCFKANDTLFQQLIKRFEEQIKEPQHSVQAKERQDATKRIILNGIGSAEGIEQHVPEAPTMLLHADEFVNDIKEMGSPRCSTVKANIKTLLLKMVEMSNPCRVFRGKKLSKRSGRTIVEDKDIISASLTLLATGVPSDFYDDLTPQLVTSGFIPRFAILEYHGFKLPPKNKNEIDEVPTELLSKLYYLLNKGFDKDMLKQMTGEKSDMIAVEFADADAEQAFETWETYCTDRQDWASERGIDSAPLWSRAKANVEKISSLIAIGCNIYAPRRTVEHVNIAIAIIRPALDKLTNIIESGQIGSGDARLASHIKEYMARMYVGGYSKFSNIPMVRKDLIDNGIIQVAVVRNYCSHLSAFRNHRNGSSKAFNDAFENMLRYGEVALVETTGDIRTKCVRLNVAAFEDEFNRLKQI